ncbi:hypothetical protein B0T16DRAFT_318726 [Cercophora newfieldiana]|uniref:Uncharacterized protein n=1 Tax=Cercophora newfieldiana TaxID=92897 RepID=A0AA39YQ44_9PEZI|nr:hypothetical protein B0T16DRAFT_318726 [Cercophora newfieldiana]
MPYITPGQVAFSALQFLPVPLLVLDGRKTVIIANEAMAQLLNSTDEVESMVPVMDRLRGESLSQIGIDLTQGGAPVWVDWGQFLDQVAAEMGIGRALEESDGPPSDEEDASLAPTDDMDTPRSNAVIEVVISQRGLNRTDFDSRLRSKAGALQVHAKMIISVWEISEHQTFFTLTFTNTDAAPSVPPNSRRKSVADLETLQGAEKQSIPAFSKPPSLASSHGSYCSSFITPSNVSLSSSPFPPLGPPARSSISSAPSILQKIMLLKDALLDNSSTPILAMWKDGGAAFPNRAARDLFNPNADVESTADGFDLLPAWAVYTEDFSRQLEPSEYPISVIIRTETPFTGFRIGMRDRKGKRLVFDVEGTALRDNNTGEFLAGVVTCRDITELAEIKASEEERFKLICDTMPQLVWTATQDGLVDFFNSRWYIYTGLTPQESLGDGWMSTFHPEDLPETKKRWKHSLATGEPYMTEYRCLSKEGEWRWFLGRALPLKNKETGDIEKWFGTCTDVHESIETKLEAKKARQQLFAQAQEKRRLVANEAAAKEASRLKSQFLANMSHEIRTPISGVIGMAELLLDDDKDRIEITQNIYRSANALLSVINDILDFSKVESGRLDIEEFEFSLSMVVEDVTKMLRFAAERKELDFRPDIAPDIESNLMLMGDPGRVRQILTNILTNSIKFTNQGHVRLSVTKEKETTETTEIKFVVEDTGIGIEDEVRKRLFQPFSQGDPSTARKFGGTGLGLTISKNLLDLMKGRMTMESRVGIGTCTTFWIPFKKPHASLAAGLTQPLPDRLQSEMSVSCNSSEYEPGFRGPPSELLDKGRSAWRHSSISLSATGSPEEDLPLSRRAEMLVLVVEDNAINQQIATKTVKKLGFQVAAVWDGKEALDYIAGCQNGTKKKPDIILMDVQMPIIDGYKCTHILRHHSPYSVYMNDIPIVAMTASAIQGDKEKAKKAGMADYLSKPVRSKMLEKMLIRWSNRSPMQVSGTSDCSESGDQCDKADIPGIIDDGTAYPSPDTVSSKWPEDVNDQITPRPPKHNNTEESMDHFPGYTVESALAGSSTSDLLRPGFVPSEPFNHDGPASSDQMLGVTVGDESFPLPLTEENIGRLDAFHQN